MNTPTATDQTPKSDPSIFKTMRAVSLASAPEEVVSALRDHILADAVFVGLIQLEVDAANRSQGSFATHWALEGDAVARSFADKIREVVSKHPEMVGDAGHPEVDAPLKDYAQDILKASSVALFSLSDRERTTGYLVVAHQEPRLYSEYEIESIQAIVGQIAVLLENLALLNVIGQQIEQLSLSNELSQKIIGAPDVESLEKVLTSGLSQRLLAAHLSLILVDDQDVYQVRHLHGVRIESGFVVEAPLLQKALADGKSIHIPDLHDLPEDQAKPWLQENIAELFFIPLQGRNVALGALSIGAATAGTLNHLDIMLIEQIAVQCAIALDNLRLVDQLQVSLHEATTLYSTALAINAAQSKDEVFDTLLHELIQVSAGHRATLYLAGPDPREQMDFVKVVAIWEDEALSITPDGPTYKLDEAPIVSQYPHTRANLVFNDACNDVRLEKGLRDYYSDKGVAAVLLLPLSTGMTWLGAVLIELRGGQAFSSDQIRLSRNLIDQAALAIDSHLLLEQTRQTAQREQVAREIMERIRHVNSPEDVVEIAASDLAQIVGLPKEEIKQLELMPERLEGSELPAEKRELIETVADQVSQTIASINLLETTRRTALREQLISDMTTQLQRSVGVDDVLETAVRTLENILKDYDIIVRLTPEALASIQQIPEKRAAVEDDMN